VRILGQHPDELAPTDIADYAVQVLRRSKIKEIYLLGRRGPAQAAFTNPEIEELCELKGCDLVVDPKEVDLDPVSRESLEKGEGGPKAKKNVDILVAQSKKGAGANPKKIIVRNLVSPVEIIGKDGRVDALKLEKNQLVRADDGSVKAKGTGQFETLPVGLVFRSVGYKGVALPELPYDPKKGTIPNETGRIVGADKKPIPQLYVVGWAKRGPSGVIGTNKPDSVETVRKLLEDVKGKPADAPRTQEAAAQFLASKGIKLVDFAGWKRIDKAEVENGKQKGKIRDKFTTIPDMLSVLEKTPA
jgi:ferredoxin--NADP+ reductase